MGFLTKNENFRKSQSKTFSEMNLVDLPIIYYEIQKIN